MKINKTLAAGLAATLAVTSLASVASAVKQRTWDMEKTYGQISYTATALKTGKTYDLGKDYLYKADAEGTDQAETFAIVDDEGNPDTDDHDNGTEAYDYLMPFTVRTVHEDLLKAIGGVNLVITGKQLASDGATTEKLVQKAALRKVSDALWILPIFVESAPRIDNNYAFMPERFVQVDSVSIEITASTDADKTFKGLSEDAYKAIVAQITNTDKSGRWNASLFVEDGALAPYDYLGGTFYVPSMWTNTIGWGEDTDPLKIKGILAACAQVLPTGQLFDVANFWRTDWNAPVKLAGGKVVALEKQKGYVAPEFYAALFEEEAENSDETDVAMEADGETPTSTDDNITILEDYGKDGGANVEFATTATEVDLSIDAKGQKLIKKLIELCNFNGGEGLTVVYKNAKYETYDEPAWLPRTANDDDKIVRDEVISLSDTDSYWSWSGVTPEDLPSAGQTYEVEDYNKGTRPYGFAGMASQFADFFNNPGNARKEAKVIFTFAVKAAAAQEAGWKNGGIPSTEVGLRNFLEEQDVKDFALFVNYDTTTGSLFATATLDADSGSVIFDVSNILAALNGTTIGSVHDLYYALATGIDYGDDMGVGLWVKEVTYEYNDAASDAAADNDKKDEEKPADNKPADNGDKEITIGGDDKETEIPADNSGNASNNGSAVVDNGANKADENPHTGVALAVIPAIVAGAAVVVSKKRK